MNKLLNLKFSFFNTNLQLALLMFFIVPLSVVAQINTDTLQEVLIKDKKQSNTSHDIKLKEFATGQQIITLDSSLLQQYKMQQVSQLLQQQLPVFIRSYGMNSMATLNFRGSSAAQSQVVWNGVPIQNAALGIADMSLFPVSMMNQVQVLYGSSSALLGSGNVGGALLLESESPKFDTTVSIKGEASLGWGSFHQYQAAA
ncbi:MAG TPA: TonB-dependent receptor plug domain-containing protein, partial [Flavipsychrobacter sp.]|nr:TonB-dependent receptor plug domain-containing protein [Flavipsychrobacter sp.]